MFKINKMSDWRTHKKYCLNKIDLINKKLVKRNDIEGFNELQNSFKRKSNKIINTKKLTWAKKRRIINKLERQTVRRANRLINENNVFYDLKDVDIFQEFKFIKINEPNDILKFYNFISTKEIPKDIPKIQKQLLEPIEEYEFKCESEKQIKHDLKEFLKHIHFPSKVLIRFLGVVETLIDDETYEYYDLRIRNGRYTTTAIINNVNDIIKFVKETLTEGINTSINNFIETNSKSKLCVIYGLQLSVYPLGLTGEFIPEINTKYSSMFKKLKIYNCNDNLCFFAAYIYYLCNIGILKIKNPSPLNNQFRSCIKKYLMNII